MTALRFEMTEEQSEIVGFALLTALRVQRLAVANWEGYLRRPGLAQPDKDRFLQVLETHRERIARIEEARDLLDAAPAIDAVGVLQ